RTALHDSNPRVREHAICLAEPFLTDEVLPTRQESPDSARSHRGNAVAQDRLLASAATKSSLAGTARRRIEELKKAVFTLAGDADPRVQLQSALTLGGMPDGENLGVLAALA